MWVYVGGVMRGARARMVEMDIEEDGRGDLQASLQRAILNGVPDGILVVDRDRKLVSVNERFFSVWGIPRPEGALALLYGTDEARLIEQALTRVADPEGFAARVAALNADLQLDDVSDIPLRDGRTLRRHTTGLGSADGTCRGRVWYFRDVSDIIQSQCALADSEQRYRTAFQTTLDAVAITTLVDGVYADVNQAFIDITGYAREEIIGHSSLELGIWADP